MSKAGKSASTTDTGKAETLPFEESLKRLEGIVEAMEAGDLPLEALLARYEEGVRLAKACQAKLADAELKIQKLERNSAGEPVLKALPAELTEES